MKHVLSLVLLCLVCSLNASGQSWEAWRDSVRVNRQAPERAYLFTISLEQTAQRLRGKAIRRDTAQGISLRERASVLLTFQADSTQSAYRLLERADQLFQLHLPPDHLHRLSAATVRGRYLIRLGQVQKADSLLVKNQQRYLATGLQNHPSFYENVTALSASRVMLLLDQPMTEAQHWLEKAMDRYRQPPAKPDDLLLEMQLHYARLIVRNSASSSFERQQADSLCRAALAQAEARKYPLLITLGLSTAALSAYAQADYDQALPLFERLAQHARSLGDSSVYAQALYNRTNILMLYGRYLEALNSYKSLLPYFQTDLLREGLVLENIGQCLMQLDELDKAETYTQRSFTNYVTRLGTNENPHVARALSILGLIAQRRFQFHQAENYLDQAQRILQAINPDGIQMVNIYMNQARLFSQLGDFDKAITLFRKARTQLQKLQKIDDNLVYANLVSGETDALWKANRMDECIVLTDSALRDYRRISPEQFAMYQGLVETALWTYTGTDRQSETDSLEAWYRQQPFSTTDSLSALSTLATRRLIQNRPAEAIEFSQRIYQSPAIRRLVWPVPDFQIRTVIAEAQYALGDQAQARRTTRFLLDSLTEKARQLLWFLPEDQRDALWPTTRFEHTHSMLLHLFGTAVEEVALAYDVALNQKGLQRNVTRQITELLNNLPDSTARTALSRWQATRERLARQTMAAEDPEMVDSLSTEANRIEKSLAFILEPLRPTPGPAIGWQRVQQALKPGEAAVELVRFRVLDRRTRALTDTVRYAALVLKPGAPPQLVRLNNGNALETGYLAEYLRGVLPRNGNLPTEPDRVSFDRYWKPLVPALKGVRTLYLAPDGVYHQLSLPTLFNPRTKRYLNDDVQLVVLHSTRELVDRPAPGGGTGAVLVGYPAYQTRRAHLALATAASPTKTPDLLRGDSLVALPGTRAEVDSLGRYLTQLGISPLILTDTAATETALKRIARPRLLHVATHGFFEPSRSREPLLQSGLAFAGAADTTARGLFDEDGWLTAYEAQHLDLTGTELVTLSACESGRGEVRTSEGVYGLQRAFAVAGAGSVLMSLWKVSDRVTGAFMTQFYRHWLGGSTKSEALRRAQAAIRQSHPEPYFWGAFVLVGR